MPVWLYGWVAEERRYFGGPALIDQEPVIRLTHWDSSNHLGTSEEYGIAGKQNQANLPHIAETLCWIA